ncbi:MAG: 2'-5' RNA ligase family protein [Chitinophagaceae bacterium]
MAPLILTLELDEKTFQFFDRQRKIYFPAERNFLAAHLTLFHHLPAGEQKVREDIEHVASQQPALALMVTGMMFTGNGVAYKLESKRLSSMHKSLQSAWQQWLIPQDKQTLRPHVTVQNKVFSEKARELYGQLSQSFIPFEASGSGLSLWEYLGGPWKPVATYPFSS